MENGNFFTYTLDEIKNLHIYGRSPRREDGSLVLFWTASGIEIRTTACEVWAELEGDFTSCEPWVSVWINGAQISRFIVEKGKRNYCLFRTLSTSAPYTLSLLKETQAMSGDKSHSLILHSLSAGTGGRKEDVFLPTEEKKLKIEFVGDSITTGEGLAGAEGEMDWISSYIAIRDNYALNTARSLKADFHILSQSGWGVVTAWDNDRKGAIPKYYEKVCGLAEGKKNEILGSQKEWDFSSWKADVIVVNLGTNDCGAYRAKSPKVQEDGTEWQLTDLDYFLQGVRDFLAKLRRTNPGSYILWAYGMCHFDLGDEIASSVEQYKKESGDRNVSFVRLDPMSMEADGEHGSRQHPGRITHERAAKKLCSVIRGLPLPAFQSNAASPAPGAATSVSNAASGGEGRSI